jgi:class 3 adenylate cyclase
VTDVPETLYTRSADGTNLAYQVSGHGSQDLVFSVGGPFPVDVLWEDPGFVRLRKRLGVFSRTVWFDARGMGASGGDPRDCRPGEVFDADLTAVIDAVGLVQPALVAVAGAGGRAIHFSAAHPEQVSTLVLVNSYAHYLRGDDYPWGLPPESLDRGFVSFIETSDTGALVDLVAPVRVGDERFRAWYARSTRLHGGPDLLAEMTRVSFEADLRPLLPSISARTLVLHRGGNRLIHLGAGRYLAEHIPNSKFVVLPGDDHLFFVGDTDGLADEIEDFLTGTRQGPEGDVVTATILFTDIVSSTEQSARMGHRSWRTVMDDHDAMIRSVLARYRGHEVATTGDGFLARFDSATRSVRAAAEIVSSADRMGIEIRAGVHTGEVELRHNDVAGLSVSIAKRICDLAGPCQTLVSEGVRAALVGSDISTTEVGTYELKGVPDEWRLFAVD